MAHDTESVHQLADGGRGSASVGWLDLEEEALHLGELTESIDAAIDQLGEAVDALLEAIQPAIDRSTVANRLTYAGAVNKVLAAQVALERARAGR